jgi:TP901 family phage tail tape measure protein
MSQQSETFNIKAIADFSQPLREAERVRSKLDKEIGSAFRNMERGFAQPLGHITGRVDEFSSSLQASNARVLAFGASAGIIFQVSKAFKDLVKNTIDVEKSMADIQVVLNTNVKQLEKYRSGIFNIAKQTGQSFFEVSKAATELARQGLTAEKTLVRLNDALVLSRLSGMDTLSSVEALTAAINGFGESVINSTQLVNKFAAVDQKFAVSSQDLAEAFKRVGSTAVDAGVSIDELIALVTTAQQITARGGSVIGNSFKTIFTRTQRPQVLDDLEQAGVKVRTFSGESLKAVDVLKNLANSYDSLTASQKSFTSEAVGGVFQINVLKALLKDIDGDVSVFSRAMEASATATDAAAKKNELLNKTLSSLINRGIENVREFSVILGEVSIKPAITKVFESINWFIEKIIQNKEEFSGVFEAIGKFVSGPMLGVAIGSLVRLVGSFAKFGLEATTQIMGLTKRSEAVARIQNTISGILASQPDLQKKILAGTISREQAEKNVLNILRLQAAESMKIYQFSSGAAGAAFGEGMRVDTKRKRLTGGGIPNFADPLRDAIKREVESGIPHSSIRVAMDSRLKSSSNPKGFGVYNTIDEPLGIDQGIRRSNKMGMDPKTHGVPNFATSKKSIYNSKTGKKEIVIVDDVSGDIISPNTGKVIGNLYDPNWESNKTLPYLVSRLTPSSTKGKSRDLYQENENRKRRENLLDTANQASENVLYSKGLRKDPIMLPMSSLGGNILQTKADIDTYINQELERRQVLTKSKGKSRDRYQEYVESVKPRFAFPENISEENESNRLAKIVEADRQNMLRIMSEALPEGALLGSPSSKPSINPLADLGPAIFRNKRQSTGSGYVLGGEESQSGLILRPNSNVGQVQGPIQGIYSPEGKNQSRRFFDEFRKVLTDPSVAQSEKKTLIDAVAGGLNKAGTAVSINSIDPKMLGDQYSVKSYTNFLKDFKGTIHSFSKAQAEELSDVIYKQGLSGGQTTPYNEKGKLSFTPINPKTGERIQNENIVATSKHYRGKRRYSVSESDLLNTPQIPFGTEKSGKFKPFTDPTSKSSRRELITQIRGINPNIPMMSASRLADRAIADPAVMSNLRQHSLFGYGEISTGRETILGADPYRNRQVGLGPRADLSSNTRSKSSLPPIIRSGNTAPQPKSGFYTRMRDMDPMNKMMMLGGIGLASSSALSYYDKSVQSNTDLSGAQKSNRSLISGGINNAMSAAGFGAMMTSGTGIGMAGGAIIGGGLSAAMTISEILKRWDDILPDLQTNLEKTATKIQKINDAAQGMTSVLFDISNAPEFKTEEERKAFVNKSFKEFKSSLSSDSLSGQSKVEISKAIESSTSLEELLSRVVKTTTQEIERQSPKFSLQKLTTSLVETQREGKTDSMNIPEMLSGIRSQKFGTLGDASSKLSKSQRESINKKLNSAIGDINAFKNNIPITENVLQYTQTGQEYLVKRELSKEEGFAKVAKKIGEALNESGLDKSSKEYIGIMEAIKASMIDGSDSAESFAYGLKALVPKIDEVENALKKFIESKVSPDIYSPRIAQMSRIKESSAFGLKMSERAFSNNQNIQQQQFSEELGISRINMSAMTPISRRIKELQLKRNTQRNINPIQLSSLRDNFESTVFAQRDAMRNSAEDGMLTPVQKGLEEFYSELLGSIQDGNLDLSRKYIDEQQKFFDQAFVQTGKVEFREAYKSTDLLSRSLLDLNNQTNNTNNALKENILLSKEQEEFLRKGLDSRYALGSSLRSESASSNAFRRATSGSDSQTEIKSSMRAFREEMGYTTNDFYTDFENNSRDAAQTFKSEFKSAFQDFRRGTVSAGEALRQMAMNFLDRIATNTSNMAIDGLMNAAFGGASSIFANVSTRRSGGMIRKKYATGGMVTGGSGVIDDVPALLTDGEMVINREAVRTYGADYFNKINQNRGVTGSLENRYLYLDANGNPSANPTQGQSRISAALSNIGATNDLMRANTTRMDREQRLVNYVTQRRSYDYQKSQAMKQYNRGIRQQAIGAGISAGIGIGAGMIGSYSGGTGMYSKGMNTSAPSYMNGSMKYNVPMGTGANYSNLANSGTIVPRSGSSNRDSYPYNLTGGEGVIKKEAVNMYGPQIVNDLNNGRVKTMRFGGSGPESSISEIRGLPSSIDRLSSAITNLQNKSQSSGSESEAKINNSFNFNIEINTDSGNVTATDTGSSQSQNNQNASDDNKKIGEAVKMVAQQAIIDGLRTGGMIYNAIRRG